MKIAGRKNDGAWFRTNKAIAGLNDTDRASLVEAAQTGLAAKAGAAFTDLSSLAAECGITWPPAAVATANDWIQKMMTDGIPRQVWNGHLSFTTYGKVGGKYSANYQSQIHYFAKDLRRFMKYWLIGQRQINDLTDTGLGFNPGGLPNADKTS